VAEWLWILAAGVGFLAFVGLLLLWFRTQCRWDRTRIEEDLGKRGGRLTSLKAVPWAASSYMDIQERVYNARYVGPDGRERCSSCRTSMLTGVSRSEEEPETSALQLTPEDSPDEAAEKIAAEQDLKYHSNQKP
jgi:hypothetical protein